MVNAKFVVKRTGPTIIALALLGCSGVQAAGPERNAAAVSASGAAGEPSSGSRASGPVIEGPEQRAMVPETARLGVSSPGQRAGEAPLPRAVVSWSSGCASTQRDTGELSIALPKGKGRGKYLLTLPPEYDPTAALPLVFAFHGRTRSHLEMHVVDSNRIHEELGGRALMLYVKSVGQGWDRPEEFPSNLALFDALYSHVLANYCVDVGRVFAVGHSSGGVFATRLACRSSDKLAGVAVVAGVLDVQCAAPTPAIFIHGRRDSVVPVTRGWHARDTFAVRNGCNSQSARTSIPACVEYTGCFPGLPVWWCDHDEPTYENTNHGWPSFASQAIASFFDRLPARDRSEVPNSISNGQFDQSSDGWEGSFASQQVGSMEARHGALCMDVRNRGQNFTDAQLLQRGLKLERGKRYKIEFRSWASAPTLLRARLGMSAPPHRDYWARQVDVGMQPRHVVDSFVMGDPDESDGSLGFQAAGAAVLSVPVTVCIDDVHLSSW